MAGIVDRYIASSWLRLLIICQGGFISIYLVVDMLENIPRFLRAGGAWNDIILFFICKFPEMFARTAAFSVLMATLLTISLLSRDSEIIAMQSCGIGLAHISRSMAALGFAVSIIMLLNAELVLPNSYERTEYISRISIKKGLGHAFFKRNNIWFRSSSLILQANQFDYQNRTLKGVIIWNLDGTLTPVSRIDAEAALFRGGQWTLHQAVIKDFSGGRGYSERKAPTIDVPLTLQIDDLRVLENEADNMSFQKLRQYADNLSSGGYKSHRYLTMMHSKLSAPFSAFVMVLLGIPFALRNNRTAGVALGIGASIAIGFSYFVVNAVLISYGRSGVITPVVAAWGANIIFMAGGIWLSLKRGM